MGLFDKVLNSMRLGDDDYDDDYDDYDDIYEEEPKSHKKFNKKEEEIPTVKPSTKSNTKQGNKITPMRQTKKAGTGMEVRVIKPTSVEDAREITDTLLADRTVILNLEGLDVEIAQRIIDFTSGSCYAISGNLQKVSNYIFIVTPNSVDISGDYQEILMGAFDVPHV